MSEMPGWLEKIARIERDNWDRAGHGLTVADALRLLAHIKELREALGMMLDLHDDDLEHAEDCPCYGCQYQRLLDRQEPPTIGD